MKLAADDVAFAYLAQDSKLFILWNRFILYPLFASLRRRRYCYAMAQHV